MGFATKGQGPFVYNVALDSDIIREVFMAEYDAKIIHKFADRLYSHARSILVMYPLVIGFLTAIIFYVVQTIHPQFRLNNFIGFFIGALIGYFYASEKAFKLKLEAQVALCQVKIEENTTKKDIQP